MIKVLDPFIADKIAAGEVIERPVSAVKELVENSIDAGASSIIVEIRGGGKSYIRVTDDGCGIPYDESETAFLRHATSKISSVSDLDSIASLGFRGEALASIAAVSRLTMVTRSAGSDTGTKIVMHGGRLVSKDRTGANAGTTIIAEDLFYNTPARRKFMKSDAREASSVIELIQHLSIFYSDIRFMMINNGQTVFSTSGQGDMAETVCLLYPDLAKDRLIRVKGQGVKGLVSDPGVTKTSRRYQLFFVNGRIVSSDIIAKGLIDGYGGRIFSGYPVAILFIDEDPRFTDVNIHPGKREIRFLRQDDIIRNISDAVSAAVSTDAGIPKAIPGRAASVTAPPATEPEKDSTQTSIRDFLKSLDNEDTKSSHIQDSDHPGIRNNIYSESKNISYEYAINSISGEDEQLAEDTAEFETYRKLDISGLSFKGYVFDTYIIMQSSDSLYIFDQHAAHERIFYEKFMRGYTNSTHAPQPVLTPFTLNVSADIYSAERDWLGDMKGFGYDIEDFGGNTFIVRGIPPYMSVDEAASFARGYIDALSDDRSGNKAVIDKLIMKSCKSAVKAHDRLSEMEINDLMRRLSECANPYSCPHGRPTFIKMTIYDIERSFRRK